MSREIDDRVVQLDFDNSKFEANVKTTMGTLERLKSALIFNKSKTNNFASVSANVTKLNNEIQHTNSVLLTIKNTFSAVEIAGMTVVNNLTSGAMRMAKQFSAAVITKPLKDGFTEYETQINSIQTILSNTRDKGTTIDEVTSSLNELNKYADDTIYNFSEMTRNIGTFTAAGVGLKDSVAAIKGIANLAAVSGSNANQASLAMYQLSQALAAGKVNLQDWDSVGTAGMSGQVFQEALKRTARQMGTGVDEALEKYGTFRESLARGGWLTKEVLVETLNQISGAYDEAALVAKGYSAENAKAIADLAKDAGEAATRVKTFTQLMDTLGEAMGSGWTQTWQTVFGDFYQVREFYTGISKLLGDAINASAEARNALFGEAFNDPWDELSKSVVEVGGNLDGFEEKIKSVARAQDIEVDGLIESYGSLREVIFGGHIDSNLLIRAFQEYMDELASMGQTTEDIGQKLEYFQKVVDEVWRGDWLNGEERVRKLTEAGYDYNKVQDLVNKTIDGHRLTLNELGDTELKAIGYTDEQIQKFRELAEQAGMADKPINKLLESLNKKPGRVLFFDAIKTTVSNVLRFMDLIKQSWNEVFKLDSSILYSLIELFNRIAHALEINDDAFAKLKNGLVGVLSLFKMVGTYVREALTRAFDLFSRSLGVVDLKILDHVSNIGQLLKNFTEFATSTEVVTAVFDRFGNAVKNVGQWIVNLVKNFANLDTIQNLIEPIKNFFVGLYDDVSKSDFGKNFLEFIGSLGTGLKSLMSGDMEDFKKNISQMAGVLRGSFAGVADSLSDPLQPINWVIQQIQANASNIGSLLNVVKGYTTDFITSVTDVFKFIDLDKVATFGGLYALVKGIDLLASALSNLKKPFESLSGMFDSFSKVGKSISSYIDAKRIGKFSDNLLKVAGAVAILAGSLWVVSQIDPERLAISAGVLAALTVSVAALTKAMSWLGTGKEGVNPTALVALASSLLLVSFALAKVAGIDSDSLGRSFASLELMVLTLGGLMIVMSKIGEKDISDVSAPILAMGASLILISTALTQIANLNPDALRRSLSVVTVLIIELGLLMVAMSKNKSTGGVVTGGGLIAAVLSLVILVEVMKRVAELNPQVILDGFLKLIPLIGALALVFLATKAAGENALAAGGSILFISVALLLIIKVVQEASAIEPDGIVKATKAVTALMAFFALMIAASHFAGKNAVKAGVMLMMAAGSILLLVYVIKMLSEIEPDGMERGKRAVTELMSVMSILVAASGLVKSNAKASIVAMATMLAVVVGCMVLISMMDPEAVTRGVDAITTLMLGMSAIMAAASSIKGRTKGLLLTLAELTLVVAALSGIMYALTKFSDGSQFEGALQAATSISVLLVAMAGSLRILSTMPKSLSMGTTMSSMGGLTVIVAGLALIVAGLGKLSTLGTDMAATIPAVISVGILLEAMAVAVLILGHIPLTGIAAAEAVLPVMAKLAAGIIAVVGILGGIGALVNGLGAKEAVIEAFQTIGDIFQVVGEAFGKLVGGVIDGFLTSAMDGFVLVCRKLQAAGAAASMVRPEAFSGLNASIAALVGISFQSLLDTYASLITGDSSIDKLGDQLVRLIEVMGTIDEEIRGKTFDEAAFGSLNVAWKAISNLVKSLPREGGLLQNIYGTTEDLDRFGSQLVGLITSVIEADNALKSEGGLDEGSSERFTNLANTLPQFAQLQESLSPLGGLAQVLSGTKDIGVFGRKIAELVRSLIKADQAMKADGGLEIGEAGTASRFQMLVDILAPLQEMNTGIDNIGGLARIWSGDNDFATFGQSIAYAARAIIQADAMLKADGGLDAGSIERFTGFGRILQSFIELGTIEFSGLWDGKQNIDQFALSLQRASNHIKLAGNNLKDLSFDNLNSMQMFITDMARAVTTLREVGDMADVDARMESLGSISTGLKEVISDLQGVDFSTVGSASSSLSSLRDFISSLTGFDISGVDSFVDAVQTLSSIDASGITDAFSSIDLSSIGTSLTMSLSQGIQNGASNVIEAVNSMMFSAISKIDTSKFSEAGAEAGSKLAEGIEKTAALSFSAASNVATRATEGVALASPGFAAAGMFAVAGFINAVSSGTLAAYAAGAALGLAAKAGVDTALGIASPAKEMIKSGNWAVVGFANALEKGTKRSYLAGGELGDAAKDGLNSAIKDFDSRISSKFVTSPTITPVLDLSDVESKAGLINNVLGKTTNIGVNARLNRVGSLNNKSAHDPNQGVIDKLDRLSDSLNALPTNTTVVNGVTYDDGTNVANAVSDLTRSLRMERRSN